MTALSALPRDRGHRPSVLERDDVALIDGVLHLVCAPVPEWQAHEEDLLFVADVLEGAGVSTRLVRHSASSVALVIDAADAVDAGSALARAAAFDPLYVKSRGRTAVPAGDFLLDDDTSPRSLRIFRPRAMGELRYGRAQGVRVEVWDVKGDDVRAPEDNALTRRRFPAEDLEEATVTRFGRPWRTMRGMFDAHPHDVDFDIDIVFSWVDGSSSEFQRQRAAQLSEYVVGEDDGGAVRYRHVDELRYALRSVYMHAPWVRRIFIATDSPRPAWLVDHPRVTLVRSEEFFADPSVLPTHNSHAVEAQLHRIPGLSEHFLYSNDDMFFGRAVEPTLFFSAAGVSSFVECDVRIGAGPRRLHRSGHDNALRLNRELLRERFGRVIVRDLEHCATPLRKSVVEELENAFPEEFARTAGSRFRSASDISVTNSLYHYYALFTGKAIASREPRVRYFQTTMTAGLRRMHRMPHRRDIDMFCLNDGGAAEVDEVVRAAAVRGVLQRTFPVVAPWENDDVSEGRGSESSAGRSAAPATAG